MIFKNVEIYFLYASSKVRWGITFALLLLIVACWWYFAFAPLRSKLMQSEHKFKNACDSSHEVDQQAVMDSINQKAVLQRISFVGDSSYFLKDLLSNGLKATNVTIEKGQKVDGHIVTPVKIVFNGTFEKFYTFLREYQKNYLCLWNSCICTKSPEGALSVNADIVIYSK